MARVDNSGLDDVLKEMKRLGEIDGTVAEDMILSGAEEYKKSWKASAKKHGYDRPGKSKQATGDMIKSIGYPRKPKTVQDALSLDIYPQGKDKKGVRNAEKAFVLHYGRTNMPGSHWVDEAEKNADGPATKAMTEVWDKHLEGK